MKVTGIYVYPVKSLRGIALSDAMVGPQGVRYDRHFMLLSTKRSKTAALGKMQLSAFPECALFSQEMELGGEDDAVVVHYHPPKWPRSSADGDAAAEKNGENGANGARATATREAKADANRVVMSPVEHPPLRIPLNPPIDRLQRLDINLHGSPARSYRMGDAYDAWFSACFGFDVVLAYIGDGQRKVLGETLKPKLTKQTALAPSAPPPSNVLAGLLSYLVAAWMALLAALASSMGWLLKYRSQDKSQNDPWLTFTDCAPLLVTAESSLRNVSARLSADVDVPMYKFRPNIVVDGEGEEEWAEDYWSELAVKPPRDSATGAEPVRLLLTSNCARCTSLNVDYATGARAAGELGEVLKRLAKDRRIDSGNKYSPVFGRYAFLDRHADAAEVRIAVGDDVTVTRRNSERTVWDWPGL